MSITEQPPTITSEHEGCWFAGASHRTADELSALIILAARDYGRQTDPELITLAESVRGWCDDEDGSAGNWLHEQADAATEYLNGLAPDGYVFLLDDGFYLLPVCATDGYEPRLDECPHVGGVCPNARY